MDNPGNEKKLEVNVEKTMEEIRKKVQEEVQREINPECLFDWEIDVAGIMRDVRQRVSNCEEIDSYELGNADEMQKRLTDIYNEIVRINTFVSNTRANADLSAEPGRIIPVSASRPLLVQKIFTIIKRFVRKATRFLVLDQMVYNSEISTCVEALCESQVQVLELTKMLAVLTSQTAKLYKEVQAQTETNQELRGRIEAIDT